MVKVGVLTFHYSNNIGAVLQAYALCRVLEHLGHEVHVINYRPYLELIASSVIRPDKLVKKYGELRFPIHKTIRSMVGEIVYYLPDVPIEIRRASAFNSFREKYLKIKPRKGITNLEGLKHECSNYEAIIVGSDLVWHPEALKYSNYGYLLPFRLRNVIKIGFSASIGVEVSACKELLTLYRWFLRVFKFISVRERRNAEELSRVIKRDVYHTLDPTLLASRKDFEEISCDSLSSLPERYALLYNLDPSLLPLAELLEKLTELPVIVYRKPDLREKLLYNKWIKNRMSFYHVSPQDFIAMLKHAELMFTDSYHGLTLSILFEKPVLVTVSRRALRIRSRIEDLADLLGLQHRIVKRKDDIVKVLREDIDYDAVKSRLNEYKRVSIELLKKALET